jgi:dinuclear metal center YbgI/SA1388 family protein
VAHRDEILAFADEFLDLASFPDYGPMGLQVVGSDEVAKIACGVSASRELFERAAAAGAQLVLVHHGLFWDRDPRVVDARMKGRLKALFDADITLAAYHLALDAHPEVGNNALLARELGIQVDGEFGEIGVGGRLAEPLAVETFVGEIRSRLGADPVVFAEGPLTVERVAIVSGGAARLVTDAAAAGYDLYLTGEADEPTMMTARELGIHFVAAGHYATETLGVQALAARLAERFGLDWEFVDLPNPI